MLGPLSPNFMWEVGLIALKNKKCLAESFVRFTLEVFFFFKKNFCSKLYGSKLFCRLCSMLVLAENPHKLPRRLWRINSVNWPFYLPFTLAYINLRFLSRPCEHFFAGTWFVQSLNGSYFLASCLACVLLKSIAAVSLKNVHFHCLLSFLIAFFQIPAVLIKILLPFLL